MDARTRTEDERLRRLGRRVVRQVLRQACDGDSAITRSRHIVEQGRDSDAQVADVSRRAHIGLVRHAAGDDDPLALRDAHDLARRRPPVALRPRAALAPACHARRRVALRAQRPRICDLEDGAVLERGAHEGVLEVEREARRGERERDDVRGERGGRCV